MKPNSTRSSHRLGFGIRLAAVCCVLCAGTGCESFQRKFTRKPSTPGALPTPIIGFQDYSQTMTPVERYRKHYLIFEYWNGELISALGESASNPKRLMRTSKDALEELRVMRSLVADDYGAGLDPLIRERASWDRQIQHDSLPTSPMSTVTHILESQMRQIHREFYWRDVEDHLKPTAPRPPSGASTGSDARTP